MKKLLTITIALVLCLSLLVPAIAEETIKIGGLAPLTGAVAQYGTAVKDGVDLAIKTVNDQGGVLGKPVEIIWEDEKGDVTEAINAYTKLVDEEDVVAIVGDVTTQPTIAVGDYAVDDGMPMITASATAYEVTEGKPNVFRACFLDPFQAVAMANFAKEEFGYTKLAVLYDVSNDYSVGLAESFVEQAEKNGQEIVAYESSSTGDVDFKAQLTNIKNAEPEAVMLCFYYQEASNIMRQSIEVGLEDAKFLSADGMNGIETMITDNDELLSRLYYTDHFAADADTPEVTAFNEAFEAEYGKAPYSAFNALGYDAALIMLEAIENAGSTDSDAIVEQLKATDLKGVTGQIKFNDHNDPIKSAFIMTMQDGVEVFQSLVNPE